MAKVASRERGPFLLGQAIPSSDRLQSPRAARGGKLPWLEAGDSPWLRSHPG